MEPRNFSGIESVVSFFPPSGESDNRGPVSVPNPLDLFLWTAGPTANGVREDVYMELAQVAFLFFLSSLTCLSCISDQIAFCFDCLHYRGST